MGKGQRPRVLVWETYATFNARSRFIDIRKDDDVDIERHGSVFMNEPLQVTVVGRAIACQRYENTERCTPGMVMKGSHFWNGPFQANVGFVAAETRCADNRGKTNLTL